MGTHQSVANVGLDANVSSLHSKGKQPMVDRMNEASTFYMDIARTNLSGQQSGSPFTVLELDGVWSGGG